MLARLIAAFVFAMLSSPAFAQNAPLPVDEAFALEVGGESEVTFSWTIAEGYYLYRDGLKLSAPDGREIPLRTKRGEVKQDPGFGRVEVYHLQAEAVAARSQFGGAGELRLTYQGCQDDGICYPPVTRMIHATTFAVSGEGGAAGAGDIGIFSRGAGPQPGAGASESTAVSRGSVIALDEARSGLVGSLLGEGGAAWLLASFVILGIALAFTPCVFPMYPILAGALARDGEKLSAKRGFALSLTYVLAMAAAFGLLGVAAAWSGQNLQIALQSPLAIGAVTAIFVALALSMFGLFELRLPAGWTNAIAGRTGGRRGGFGSTAALGFTSALIVGPCVTAPLAGALIYIAQTGDVVLGAGALFALGIGKGIPLIAFGTFGAGAMPRSGAWMRSVSRVFGFIFLGAAIYMLSRLIPGPAALFLWSALLIAAGVFAGAFDAMGETVPASRRIGKATGVLALICGAILAVGAAFGASDPLRPFEHFALAAKTTQTSAPSFGNAGSLPELDAALHEGPASGSLVYFTADWCVVCKAIDRNVFNDPAVIAGLGDLRLVKVDVTENTPAQQGLMRELGVAGPPTMIFLDAEAREVPGSRKIGDVGPTEFLAAAAQAKGVSQ